MITFPRDLPEAFGVTGLAFQLVPMQELSPLRSGGQIALDLGPSLWMAQWQCDRLNEQRLGVARAWLDTLSSLNPFYAFDMLREYPFAYRQSRWQGLTVGGDPFDGTCLLTDVASNGVEIDLEALPAGFVLTPGDYLAFDYGDSNELRALHRVSASKIANGSGVALALEVRPRVRPGWQENATVQLYRAACKMLIVPQSVNDGEVRRPGVGPLSFQGVQTL